MKQLTTTNYTNCTNWLRRSWRVLFLLAIFNCPFSIVNSVKAQSSTDAFYIYQNDGHFDGFFYDQVEKITYSRVDTAGIEWDDFVSQEIVTADSTYRIMLSAIDSVGFVQPEIRFNPSLRRLDEEGLSSYIVSAEGMMLVLRGDVPASLLPQKDQVLACPKIPGREGPFVGPYEYDGKIYVPCSKITQLSDVFDQFISVEEVITDDSGAEVRRRLAGVNPRRAEGNWNADIFQFNIDREESYQLSDKWKILLNLHGGFGMKAQVVYNISATKFFLKMLLEERVEFGFRGSIDGVIGESDNVLERGMLAKALTTLSRLHLPANFPVVYMDVVPKPFLRGEAHFNVGLSMGVSSRFFQQWFLISSEPPYFDGDLVSRNTSEWVKPSLSITAELNGMVQTGMKLPFKIGTEDVFSYLMDVNVGNTIYIGPKLTASFSLDVISALSGGGVYDAFKNSKLTFCPFSYDSEMKFRMEGLWGKPKERKYTFNKSYGTVEFGAFPEFSDVKYEITGDNDRTIHATMNVNGEVFMPQYIGFALYDKNGKELDYVVRNETYLINTFNEVEAWCEDLDPGIYFVRPITRLFGKLEVPIYSEEDKIAIEALQLKLDPSVVSFDKEGGWQVIVAGGGPGGPLSFLTLCDWIHPETMSQYSQLQIHVDPNETNAYREGKVVVYEKVNDTEELSDTLLVRQYSDGISLSRNEVELAEDGGTEVLNVFSMLPDVRTDISEDSDPQAKWLHVELGGEALTVTADANRSTPRSATVTLVAPNLKGDGIVTVYLKVNQKAYLSIPVDTVFIEQDGRATIIDVTNALPTLTLETDAEWLTVGPMGNNSFYARAGENNRKPREAELYVTATDGEKIVTKTLVVVQDGITREEDPWINVYSTDVTLPAQGGSQEVTVKTNMETIYIEYDDEQYQWLTVSYNPQLDLCTFTASANDTKVERSCPVVLSVYRDGKTKRKTVHVTQPPVLKLLEYDGVTVTFRYGGDLKAQILGKGYVYCEDRPIARGVYGTGMPGVDGASIHSSGDDPSLGSWHAYFATDRGFMHGSFSWVNASKTEGYSFDLNGAPVGQSGPLNFNSGSGAGSRYWTGDAAICYPSVEEWGYAKPTGETYISGFSHWIRSKDEEGNYHTIYKSYWETPVEVSVFLHIVGSSSVLPYGHPDAK